MNGGRGMQNAEGRMQNVEPRMAKVAFGSSFVVARSSYE
jgi:hypothetical protein